MKVHHTDNQGTEDTAAQFEQTTVPYLNTLWETLNTN